MDPFSLRLNLNSGDVKGNNLIVESKTLFDLRYSIQNQKALTKLLKNKKDIEVYTVSTCEPGHTAAHLTIHVTRLKPGKIGEEFFFTKGHIHKKPTAEWYLGISGTGLLLLWNKNKHLVLPFSRGDLIYIPPGWAHRTINVGDEDLVFLSCHRSDAGYDYDFVVEKGAPKRILASDKELF
ncbi:MAG: glucose-6-phosphate isomerase family protein [Candidatus Hadarchaeum sp.]|uniref:glucose-6-phosphate isomerase family protein n=1 Tax=Candidatus Hadarchaeum sp. TaxID=2883567 RepID=UPI00317DFE71